MNEKKREKLVQGYLNTSVDDMKSSISKTVDPKLLLNLLFNCNFYGFTSKAKVVERRIYALIRAGAKKDV